MLTPPGQNLLSESGTSILFDKNHTKVLFSVCMQLYTLHANLTCEYLLAKVPQFFLNRFYIKNVPKPGTFFLFKKKLQPKLF